MSSLSVLFIYVENMKPMMHGMSVMMTLQTILIIVLNVMYCRKADFHIAFYLIMDNTYFKMLTLNVRGINDKTRRLSIF